MDCRDFDEQVVRLDRLRDVAEQFVRVRLTRIDDLDLSLFDFDYDLTMMVFFMDANERLYARYGQRDAEGPDTRQTLDGLRYTMQSVLAMHQRPDKAFAPRARELPKHVRDVARGMRGRGCMHCHQVKEILNTELKRTGQWERDLVWRYPPPDNLGFILDVDRGNVVEQVKPDTPAARAGLARGDVVRRLNGVPVHSIADAQYGLDRAPAQGVVPLSWERAGASLTGTLPLPEGWRRGDISWRRSMDRMVPSARLSGRDLTAEEKKALGLPAGQLAFRQQYPVHSQARDAGVRQDDIILGFDDKRLEMDCNKFIYFVRQNYLVGDRVTVSVLRDGERLKLPMTLR